ncbi:DUF6099 family protein [Streptomyces sp. H10-C2]|uniref:DUF6099 family protein n=1 Tax=unclassified Streptomyces TaxID=2593676 RepID=UPI0024BB66BE|nr:MULTISPECIES: DUF6099 family protein [unclassified Streptomyces]MDJ0344713.1 DUF6099 family protein [Streptomyces sp. PH10-H1]MDJ0372803.1 DUF6099 family protein [Streptomyces sp. H10-C2]
MDAVRLIMATRHALEQAWQVQDLITEAWQAQALAEAVGGHLALHGPPELRAAGFSVCEAGGGRGCGPVGVPGPRMDAVRAAILTGVREPARALTELRDLLSELGAALVGVACSADDEAVYWQCIDAVDAAEDSKDRVCALLRAVGERPGERPGERTSEDGSGERPGDRI